MKSWDYHALTYNGGVYCTECLPVDPEMEECDHTGTAPGPVFADQEWDHYPVCDVCHTVHDYVSLTEEGRANEGGS
jgi:hypothetical protein